MLQNKSNTKELVESNKTDDDDNSNNLPETQLLENTMNNNNDSREAILTGDDEATDTNDTTAKEHLPLEKESKDSASDQDIMTAWTEAWDDQSQAYYWWNTITYETTWDNPNDTNAAIVTATATASEQQQTSPEKNELDSVLDTIDTKVRARLDGPNSSTQAPSSLSASAYPYGSYNDPSTSASDHNLGATDPYRFQAFFNTKTGRFQNTNDVAQRHPDQYTMEARAKRQMEHYFDVEAYQAERNQQLEQGRKRSLSRKEIERFKRAKKEKKANRMREWLRD
ncbi:hypothetical protein BCR42DRAFT_419355 [Absidia repens]|uniref:WW domain-containing protein n=1 Tax=Absidia repens TaxID=90262 RepID=A0A1X2IB70_9FUNG|nr:hypothetical protein BCR42DRAFT_419355 [Absidia repens]